MHATEAIWLQNNGLLFPQLNIYAKCPGSITILIFFLAALTEDYCGVEPITHPPDIVETRPPPIIDEDKLRKAYNQTDSAILGSMYFLNV